MARSLRNPVLPTIAWWRAAWRSVAFASSSFIIGDGTTHGSNAKDSLNIGFADRCRETDQPIAALLTDLKERGMLEDTLVVWGGEFGRTSMRENRNGQVMQFIGRDHNPGAFTIWMAGGGIKPGMSYGETDAMGYEIVKDPVEIRDLHATILYAWALIIASSTIPSRGWSKNSPA